MKSGAPAFGTPEFVQAAFGAGQLARHIGLPWRGSAATASNAPDEQSVYEFTMSAWGSILGGVNMMVHAAGWLEGGLTASMEKYILDIEVLQNFAEIFHPLQSGEKELAFDAIAAVETGLTLLWLRAHDANATRLLFMNHSSPTGATMVPGRKVAAKPRPNAPMESGKKSCGNLKHPKLMSLFTMNYRILSIEEQPKAVHRQNHNWHEFFYVGYFDAPVTLQ